MTKNPELATEVMRTDSGLHADKARRHIGRASTRPTRPLPTQHDRPAFIKTDDVERVLADIYADYCNRSAEILRHGVLLVFWRPLPASVAGGQEHGGTIPLAGRSQIEIPQRSNT
jgi:hypothetical protein